MLCTCKTHVPLHNNLPIITWIHVHVHDICVLVGLQEKQSL